jgi:hypothetical protein
MPRVKQRVHRFGIEHQSHQRARSSPGSAATSSQQIMIRYAATVSVAARDVDVASCRRLDLTD